MARRASYNVYGRLAQLGERLPYKEDVGGSSPSSPISFLRRGKSLLCC